MRPVDTVFSAQALRILRSIYGISCRAQRKIFDGIAIKGLARSNMLNWLMSDCHLFGLTVQNWMWAFPGALLSYLAVLIFVRRQQAG